MERIFNDVNEKQWGMFLHLATFAGLVIPFGNIIGPLVIYLIKKDEYQYVREQGIAVLNFQITWSIIFVISGILVLAIIGIFLLIGFGIAWLVFVIMGIIAADQGKIYTFPLTINFIQ